LELLERAAREGHIRLKYLDETGFCMWSSLAYTWSIRGHQYRQEQTDRRGRRLSLIGVWEPGVGMTYALALGSINSARYIRFMESQALQAQRRLQSRDQITVIVQDNGSNHTSHAVQACIPRWQSMGLFFFQLPPYCSEMNPIEIEWRQIKANGIRGRMFDDEYDLALAVIASVSQRGQLYGYRAERFNFKTHRLIRSPLLAT
jgi:putative transposase